MENNGFINIDITSTCQHLAQGLGNFIGGISSFAGNILGELSYQLLPPFVQDPFCLLAHVMVNGTIRGFTPSYSQQHSTNGMIFGDNGDAPYAVGFHNGMCNNLSKCIESGLTVSDAHGKITTWYTLNAGHGFIADLGEVGINLLGIPTNAVFQFVDMVRSMDRAKGAGVLKIIHCHSHGGLIPYLAMKYLTQEERDSIIIVTYGSAWLSFKGYGAHINIVHPYDPVPVIANFYNPNLSTVNPSWWKVPFSPHKWEHSFLNECYQSALREIANLNPYNLL